MTRRGRWKAVLIFLGALALVAVAILVWLWSVADRKWAEMVVRVDQLIQEYKARDVPWPPLRGEALPGSAQDDYGPASAALRSVGHSILGDFVVRSAKADRAKVEAAIAAHPGAVEALRNGARKERGRIPYDWKVQRIPGLLDHQRLANFAVCRSRFLREEGKHREAADLMTSTARYGEWVGDNGPLISEMIGIAILSLTFDEIREILEEKKLAREDLAALEAELAILDRTFIRHGASLRNEVIYSGSAYLEAGAREWFLARLLPVHAFFETDRYLAEAAEAQEKNWSDLLATFQQISTEAASSKNPLVRMVIPSFVTNARVGRERRAQLRLLRMAVHFLATGEALDLEDPFGAKLGVNVSGSALRTWSVGRDGADQGGTGAWKPNPSGDIVLEITR